MGKQQPFLTLCFPYFVATFVEKFHATRFPPGCINHWDKDYDPEAWALET